MKRLFVFVVLLSFLVGCDDDDPNDTPNTDTYYIRLSYDGTEYYKEALTVTQIGHSSRNELGGFAQNMGIDFFFSDDVKNIDVIAALENQRIYFDDYFNSFPSLYITHSVGLGDLRYTENALTSMDLGPNYYADITEVTFVKNVSDLNMDVYAIRGSFKTRIENGTGFGNFSDATGDFYIECTHTTN